MRQINNRQKRVVRSREIVQKYLVRNEKLQKAGRRKNKRRGLKKMA